MGKISVDESAKARRMATASKAASCRRTTGRWREGDVFMTTKRSIKVIGIAGGSGSGKSWLADRLVSALGDTAVAISLDSFYRHRPYLSLAQRARVNYDHPRAIDWDEVLRVLRTAREGRTIRVPEYDYSQHLRSGGTRNLRPAKVLILEGLWTLRRRELQALIDLGVFVEATAKWRLERRLERDVRERGRSRASVVRQFRGHVEPMHQRFVAPQTGRSDVILESPINDEALSVLLQRVAQLPVTTRPLQS
jgi:uridine kinase